MWECPMRAYKYSGLSWKTHLHWFAVFPLRRNINTSCEIFICILHDSQNIWWFTTCHRGNKTLLTALTKQRAVIFFMAVPIWWHHPSLKWHKTNLNYSHEGIFLSIFYIIYLYTDTMKIAAFPTQNKMCSIFILSFAPCWRKDQVEDK